MRFGAFNNLLKYSTLSLTKSNLDFILLPNRKCKFLICASISFLTGTIFSAAAVGVEALKSETKSIIVLSV